MSPVPWIMGAFLVLIAVIVIVTIILFPTPPEDYYE